MPTATAPKGEVPKDMRPPKFVGNVGIDKEIFQSNHNFFRLINDDKEALRNRELMKLNAPYEVAYKTKTGKKLKVNIYADFSEPEFTRNFEVGKRIIDELNLNVYIRPHINNRIASNIPNPEYLINGKIGDRKAVTGLNFRNALNKANNIQKTEIVVIDLIDNPHSIEKVLSALRKNFKEDSNYPLIKQIIIVSKDRKTVKIYDRDEIKKG